MMEEDMCISVGDLTRLARTLQHTESQTLSPFTTVVWLSCPPQNPDRNSARCILFPELPCVECYVVARVGTTKPYSLIFKFLVQVPKKAREDSCCFSNPRSEPWDQFWVHNPDPPPFQRSSSEGMVPLPSFLSTGNAVHHPHLGS